MKSQEETLKELAETFLCWPLPESVCADRCATEQGKGRVGTNLLSYVEAMAMMNDVVKPVITRLLAAGCKEGGTVSPASKKCPTCDGKGEWSGFTGAEPCLDCHGTGLLPSDPTARAAVSPATANETLLAQSAIDGISGSPTVEPAIIIPASVPGMGNHANSRELALHWFAGQIDLHRATGRNATT